MVVLEAEDELKQPVETARLYDVVLRATGSEEKASDALAARIAQQLARGEKPEL